MTITEKMRSVCKQFHALKEQEAEIKKALKPLEATIKEMTDGHDTDYGTWVVNFGTRKSAFYDMDAICEKYGINPADLEQFRKEPSHPMTVKPAAKK